MTIEKSIEEFVVNFRNKVEPHWSTDLLYKKFEKKLDMPKSTGYCGPTSIFLLEELRNQFPDENFSLALGRVYSDSKEWIKGKHVWVVWHHGLKSSTIIDVTADQSDKIGDKIIFENADKLASKDINYITYQLARNFDEVDESPKKRAAILKSKIENK